MEIGEVRDCAHCSASGSCSCESCRLNDESDYEEGDGKKVPCSVCEGKGAVWIGPDVVQIRPD
jgi:hypothetical protein